MYNVRTVAFIHRSGLIDYLAISKVTRTIMESLGRQFSLLFFVLAIALKFITGKRQCFHYLQQALSNTPELILRKLYLETP